MSLPLGIWEVMSDFSFPITSYLDAPNSQRQPPFRLQSLRPAHSLAGLRALGSFEMYVERD
jgi:hypothetical protein